ncbi:hypothetical protein SARC_00663 [Sphaeroforma arctica JP610]|uniref:Uncharacterized protein n=1 Tax=Sphaeroforma arctica JP610 TaxID=667725 RepID=A0A0L0GG17_9EUKA|nr:hypothetical protein SARC_00663 [Sphaeroforma arctica JP610]KNC87228.1 hypothetical protein SARC_00663 [Sphaeroforma arctica JP610]|eukprot:XP_014161130.1 hypothetical protein SARC_00663 [Sphaeroforma arctica JP610]
MPSVVFTEGLQREVTRGLANPQLFKNHASLKRNLQRLVNDAEERRQNTREMAIREAKLAEDKLKSDNIVEKASKLNKEIKNRDDKKGVAADNATTAKEDKKATGTNDSVDVSNTNETGSGGLSDSLKDLLQKNTSGKKAPPIKESSLPDDIRESKDTTLFKSQRVAEKEETLPETPKVPVTIPFALVKDYWELARAADQYEGRLFELLLGSEIYETPYVPPPKCPELVHRLKRLEIMSQEAEYRRMTRNVDTSRIRKDAQTDARELKGVKQQFFMLVNVVLSAGGVYLAAYYALYNQLSYGPRVGVSTLAMVVAVVAEIWLFLKGEIFYNNFEKPSKDREEKKRVDAMVSSAMGNSEKTSAMRNSTESTVLAEESKKES